MSRGLTPWVLLTALTAACGGGDRKTPPKPDDGVVDLRGWDFDRDGPVKLCGEWKFAWRKDQAAFRRPGFDASGWSTIEVPKSFKDRFPSPFGYGWYHLRVRLRPQHGLAYAQEPVNSATALFVNGTRRFTLGHPAATRGAERPRLGHVIVPLPRSGEYVLALHVSNFHHHFGGLDSCPILGRRETLKKEQWEKDVVSILIIGIILMAGVFNLLLWIGRPKDRAPLFFALLCLTIAGRVFLVSGFMERLFAGDDVYLLRHRLEYITIPLSTALIPGFFYHLYPQDYHRLVMRVFQAVGLAFTAFILVTPQHTFTSWLALYNVVMLACLGYTIFIVIQCIRRGRQGGWVVITGFGVGALAALNLVLHAHASIGSVHLGNLGMAAFFLIQSSVIAVRYARSFRTAEHLSAHLQDEVSRKTQALRQQTEEALEAQQQAETAAARIEEADRLKTVFFQNISHELRTPLTLLLGPLEQLQAADLERLSAEDLNRRFEAMERSGHRLLRLVNQLLDFARLEAGGRQVTFHEVDVTELLGPVVDAFRDIAKERTLRLGLKAPPEVPRLRVDVEAFEKAITNLVTNALKFTGEGGSVMVRVEPTDTEIQVSVKDTGIGIRAEDLPHIFDRFRQLDDAATRHYEGTGIGLALAKELIERSGGTLTVRSEPGLGSTFTLHLPRGEAHVEKRDVLAEEPAPAPGRETRSAVLALAAELGLETPEPKIPAPRTPAGDAPRDGARLPLLVVEDNADMRRLVRTLFQDEYRVIEAENGAEGLAAAREHAPAVVIADLMMPEMDGHEMLRALREDPDLAQTPVLLLTAKAGVAPKIEGLRQGADDYVSKPFDLQELRARVANLVRTRRQETALQETNQQLRDLQSTLQEETVRQSLALDRARQLGRSLPPSLVQAVLEGEAAVSAARERRRLSLFRIELRGFRTTGIEPGELTALLNGYLTAMMELAHTQGATVDHVVRDRVSGFFGAPESAGPEQDAARAIHLARDLWRQARDLCRGWETILPDAPPRPTVVVHSGMATVGTFGPASRLEYTAVGLAADQADALIASSPAGSAVCTLTTWKLVPKPGAERTAGEVTLPGRDAPMPLYRLDDGNGK